MLHRQTDRNFLANPCCGCMSMSRPVLGSVSGLAVQVKVQVLALASAAQSGLSLGGTGGSKCWMACRSSPGRSKLPLSSPSHRIDPKPAHKGPRAELAVELALSPVSAMVLGKAMVPGRGMETHRTRCPRQCKTQRARRCICTPRATATFRAHAVCPRARTRFVGSAGRTSNGHLCWWHPSIHEHRSIG